MLATCRRRGRRGAPVVVATSAVRPGRAQALRRGRGHVRRRRAVPHTGSRRRPRRWRRRSARHRARGHRLRPAAAPFRLRGLNARARARTWISCCSAAARLVEQIGQAARALDGRRSARDRAVDHGAAGAQGRRRRSGYTEIIERAGGKVLGDSCPAMSGPCRGTRVFATDSAKQAIPAAILGIEAWFAPSASASRGRNRRCGAACDDHHARRTVVSGVAAGEALVSHEPISGWAASTRRASSSSRGRAFGCASPGRSWCSPAPRAHRGGRASSRAPAAGTAPIGMIFARMSTKPRWRGGDPGARGHRLRPDPCELITTGLGADRRGRAGRGDPVRPERKGLSHDRHAHRGARGVAPRPALRTISRSAPRAGHPPARSGVRSASRRGLAKPKIAIVNSSSALAICFSHLDEIAQRAKRAIERPGSGVEVAGPRRATSSPAPGTAAGTSCPRAT